MTRRGWLLAVAAALALAVGSLASNITTQAQLERDADTFLAARLTVSMLLNSGTVWAGLGVLAGWLVFRPSHAFAAGTGALLLALLAHYGLGRLIGVFGPEVWGGNSSWFVAAVCCGGALGLVGATARQAGSWGMVGRLVVPVAAVVEPFVVGMFTHPAVAPSPERVAGLVSGVVLVGCGVAGVIAVLARSWKDQSTAERPAGLAQRLRNPG